jgi:hypothetical protein
MFSDKLTAYIVMIMLVKIKIYIFVTKERVGKCCAYV